MKLWRVALTTYTQTARYWVPLLLAGIAFYFSVNLFDKYYANSPHYSQPWTVALAVIEFLATFGIMFAATFFFLYRVDNDKPPFPGRPVLVRCLKYFLLVVLLIAPSMLLINDFWTAPFFVDMQSLGYTGHLVLTLLQFIGLIILYYLTYRLGLTFPAAMDGVATPLTTSIRTTRGRFWKIFLHSLLFLVIVALPADILVELIEHLIFHLSPFAGAGMYMKVAITFLQIYVFLTWICFFSAAYRYYRDAGTHA